MELVWHNCLTCPPEEVSNPCLCLTDGEKTIQASYFAGYWYYNRSCYEEYRIDVSSGKYWWADLNQTTTGFFSPANKN